jgi:uncharacterized membrane protein
MIRSKITITGLASSLCSEAITIMITITITGFTSSLRSEAIMSKNHDRNLTRKRGSVFEFAVIVLLVVIVIEKTRQRFLRC